MGSLSFGDGEATCSRVALMFTWLQISFWTFWWWQGSSLGVVVQLLTAAVFLLVDSVHGALTVDTVVLLSLIHHSP